MCLKKYFLSIFLLLGFSISVNAGPALIYDLGGKFDKSFNEAAFNGAEKWKADTGGSYLDIELQSEAQREQALRRFAESGANPIIVTGFAFSSVLSEVAPDYPDTKFGIIDGYAPLDNVLNIGFSEHEGSFLVGMIAGMKSKSGVVGFIGGMDIPLIRRFGCGYAQGVNYANSSTKVVANMTGTTPTAWNDPVKGSELTQAQISQGADIVYAAAGGTGVGVLQTAADQNILSIGVDSNQNYLHPGKVLTSMIKRVDVAVYNAFTDGENLKSGFASWALANDGVGYSLDEYNESLMNSDIISAVEKAKSSIVSGELKVHDYMSDDNCPFLTF